MVCSACHKEVLADRRFCTWCERFVSDPRIGSKAGVFGRLSATILDAIVFWVVFFLILFVFSVAYKDRPQEETFGGIMLAIFLAWAGYGVVLLWFLARGLTPGKLIMHERVVEHLTGRYPGLGRMLVRELFGKFISGLFLGLGYFWAIWDRDGQTWHDKIAGTLVVKWAAK